MADNNIAYVNYQDNGACNVVPCIVNNDSNKTVWMSSETLQEGGSCTIRLNDGSSGPGFSADGTTFFLGFRTVGGNPHDTTWDSGTMYTYHSDGGTARCEFTGTVTIGTCTSLAPTNP